MNSFKITYFSLSQQGAVKSAVHFFLFMNWSSLPSLRWLRQCSAHVYRRILNNITVSLQRNARHSVEAVAGIELVSNCFNFALLVLQNFNGTHVYINIHASLTLKTYRAAPIKRFTPRFASNRKSVTESFITRWLL